MILMVFFECMKMFRLQSEYEAQISEWGALEAIVLQQDRWVSVFFLSLNDIKMIWSLHNADALSYLSWCFYLYLPVVQLQLKEMQNLIDNWMHSWYLSQPPQPAVVYFFHFFIANLRTFWSLFTGLNYAVVSHNWKVSRMKMSCD